nr:allo A subunit beta [Trypoxylus dichotomus]BCK60277.1 allo A subunit beta [Trypoxylus dichotomus]
MVKMANLKIFYCLLFCIVKLATAYYCWRDFIEDIPRCVITTNRIIIAQAPYYGLLPGSFDFSTKTVVTERGGKKVVLDEAIKFLCDKDDSRFSWERVNSDSLAGDGLKNLVLGGYESNSNIYIGKVFLEGEWQVGKVFPASSQFKGYRGWYLSNDTLYQTDDFQVLKYK